MPISGYIAFNNQTSFTMKKRVTAFLAAFVLLLSATLLSMIMITLADFVGDDIYAESGSEYVNRFYGD